MVTELLRGSRCTRTLVMDIRKWLKSAWSTTRDAKWLQKELEAMVDQKEVSIYLRIWAKTKLKDLIKNGNKWPAI